MLLGQSWGWNPLFTFLSSVEKNFNKINLFQWSSSQEIVTVWCKVNFFLLVFLVNWIWDSFSCSFVRNIMLSFHQKHSYLSAFPLLLGIAFCFLDIPAGLHYGYPVLPIPQHVPALPSAFIEGSVHHQHQRWLIHWLFFLTVKHGVSHSCLLWNTLSTFLFTA